MTVPKTWLCEECNEIIAELAELAASTGKYGMAEKAKWRLLIWQGGERFLVCPHCGGHSPIIVEETPGEGASISRPIQ